MHFNLVNIGGGSLEAKKPKQNRFRINQSVVLQNMNLYKNRNVRDSIVKSKNTPEQLFSSVGSGPILSNIEAPPISIRQKRKIGQNKGSIEIPNRKLGNH